MRGDVLRVDGEREPSEARRRLAAGSEMLLPAELTLYRVLVRYREPAYDRRHGARLAPCEWSVELRASSEANAVAGALEQFRALERKSSVAWVRQVVDAVASPADSVDDVDDADDADA